MICIKKRYEENYNYNVFENVEASLLYDELMNDLPDGVDITISNDVMITVDMMRTLLKFSYMKKHGELILDQ